MRLPTSSLLPAIPLLLAAACAPGAAPSGQPALTDEVEQEVAAAMDAVTDSITAAMNAHDADRILAFFDSGPDFVYVACTDVIVGGEMYGNLTRSLHGQKKGVTYEVTAGSTTVLGPDAAVVSLRTESSDTLTSDPVFTTRVLSRGAGGRWKTVYQHQSWPGCKPPKQPHPMTSATPGGLEAAADTLG